MQAPPELPREAERLAALHALRILDTAAEAAYDQVVDFVCQQCQVPMGLVTLVDADRQWFKARRGVALSETPRRVSFCGHALSEAELLEVPDALKDPRFADNPLVTGAPFIRFYAGAVVHDEAGLPLGTACALDTVPRQLTPQQRQALLQAARNAALLLALRASSQRMLELHSSLADKQAALGQLQAVASHALAQHQPAFLSHMGHELRTPLNLMLGYAQTLDLDPRLDAQHKDSVEEILRAGWQLLQLLDAVLQSSERQRPDGTPP
ncbi:GAF domain-containing protein [Aquabacterium sp. A08]|uniref:GAF domain-containing protein n=2 Tax=Aquabacterium sp. A08 TaxID=2718532 RepID=UPI001420D42C|nr:GAF domain-containing protein [Aquabacterium sp. A08]NIC40953.1 GAF domain-containing protein [Aquabacterium sp. A08]NIC40961.1 GAF domain-containing protein [Aquabacterium sp. A08]